MAEAALQFSSAGRPACACCSRVASAQWQAPRTNALHEGLLGAEAGWLGNLGTGPHGTFGGGGGFGGQPVPAVVRRDSRLGPPQRLAGTFRCGRLCRPIRRHAPSTAVEGISASVFLPSLPDAYARGACGDGHCESPYTVQAASVLCRCVTNTSACARMTGFTFNA